MKKILVIISVGFLFSTNIFAQEDPVAATRLVLLYCFADVLNRPSVANVVVTKTENTLNKECVDRVRITFKNSDNSKINNITFDLIISEKSGSESQTLYQARHFITLPMLINEVKTFDLQLNNQISPPEGRKDFDDKNSWSWKIEIVKINSK